MAATKPDVFVSYAHEDGDFVQRLVDRLRTHALDCWHDRSHMPLGGELTPEIRSAIGDSWYFVVVVSSRSDGSEWVRRETGFALDASARRGSPRIVAIVLDDPAAGVPPDRRADASLRDVVDDVLRFRAPPGAAFDAVFDGLWAELTRSLRIDLAARVGDDRPRFTADPLACFTHGFPLGVSGVEPAWANDGDGIVFARHLELHVAAGRGMSSDVLVELGPLDAGGDDEEAPTSDPVGARACCPTASVDGRWVAFWHLPGTGDSMVTAADLVVVERSTGVEAHRTRAAVRVADGYVDPAKKAWSPRAAELAFVCDDRHAEVLDLASDPPRLLAPGPAAATPHTETVTWSPDGRHLLAASGGGGVHTLHLLDRTLRPAGPERRLKGSHVRWLDDDEVLMVGGGAGTYELATVDPFTMRRRRVLSRSDEYRYFEVAPDRATIAYWQPVDGAHELRAHRLDDDTVVTLARWDHGIEHGPERPHPHPPAWHPSSGRVVVGVDDAMVVLEVPF